MTSLPTIRHLPASRVELKFIVTPEEARPYLARAAEKISVSAPIKGFRPGKATYHDVQAAYGEMRIWETALETLVRTCYAKAILDNHLNTIGSPEVSIDTLVPNQPIAFTTTSSLMPTVTKLAEYTRPRVTQKTRSVTEAEMNKALRDLRVLRRHEVGVDRAATQEDAVVIDLEIKKDGVLIEGGSARAHKLYLNETYYIPGFAEKLIGIKRGEERTFELEFPKEHYNTSLAGHRVVCRAEAKEIFEIRLPEETDEFAQGLNCETMSALKNLLQKNLQEEQDQKSLEAAEIELLEQLVQESRFSEIPELLINEEVRRMYEELRSTAEQQGMRIEDYLASLKKTSDEVKLGFVPRALERIRTIVLMQEIGAREHMNVTDAEIEAEQNRLLDALPRDEAEARARIGSPEYREHIATLMKNRKILAFLKEKGIRTNLT